jgi:hypothetical protein
MMSSVTFMRTCSPQRPVSLRVHQQSNRGRSQAISHHIVYVAYPVQSVMQDVIDFSCCYVLALLGYEVEGCSQV